MVSYLPSLPLQVSDERVTGRICEHFLIHYMVNPYAAGGLFGQNNMMQKSRKMTETLANGYSYESTQ